MKKSCFLLLIFASFSVNAQIGLTYGLKVSSNYNPNPDLPNRLGFSAGLIFNKKISDKFKIQTELTYTKYIAIKEFSNIEGQIWGIIVTSQYSRDYVVSKKIVQLPILAQYYFTNRIYMEGGPQLGYVIDGKLSYTQNDPDIIEGATIVTKMKNQFDFGASLGLGYYITKSIGISTRYYTGIIEKDNLINFGIEFKIDN